MENIIFDELKKLTNKAIEENEVPIAAIIVKNNIIVGRGYNKVEQTQNFMNHAEIIAINEAQQNLNNWRLNDCKMYVTLEPCSMCKEIIKKSRISDVYYLSKQNEEQKDAINNYEYIEKKYFSDLLTTFFKEKRRKYLICFT